jgi:hypothetical protein
VIAVIASNSAPQRSDVGVAAADEVEEEFLALVYADEELLRAEFDALIAAAWGQPRQPGRPRRAGRPTPPPPGRPGRDSPSPAGCARSTIPAPKVGPGNAHPQTAPATRHHIQWEQKGDVDPRLEAHRPPCPHQYRDHVSQCQRPYSPQNP